MGGEHLTQRGSPEWGLPGYRRRQHRADAVNITQVCSSAARDLGCEILDCFRRMGDVHLSKFTQHADIPQSAEVAQKYMPAFKEEDVARLDITVNDVQTVCVAKSITELTEKWRGIGDSQTLPPGYPILERTGGDIGRYQIQIPSLFTTGQ